MCTVALIPLVTAAIGVAGSVYSSYQQNQAANAVVKGQNQIAQANIAEGQREYGIRNAGIQATNTQEAAAAAQANFEAKQRTLAAQGEAGADFAGRGVGGGALNTVINSYAQEGSRAVGASNQRLRFSGVQSDFNLLGANQDLRGTYLSNPKQSKVPMDWVGSALNGIGAGAGGYSSGLTIKQAIQKPG